MADPDHNNPNLPNAGDVLQTRRNEYKVGGLDWRANAQVGKLLGKGGFGAVFEVKAIKGNDLFACKCETMDVRKQVLTMDCHVLRGAFLIKSPHFCSIVDRGKVEGRFRYLIMKLVGRNLWDLRVERPEHRFTLSTSLKAAEQCLIAIEDLHRIGYLHRDVKPGNFAIGRPETNEHHTVFMLDFGLCRKFVGDSEGKDLRIPRASAPFRGTTRYAPMAALRNIEQSRKDDIEAWLYMVVEWTAGQVPWRKCKGPDKDEVLRAKEACRQGEALEDFLIDCPKREFQRIMEYLDSLSYHNIPDYEYVYFCIQHACKAHNIKPSEPLDWDPTNKYHGPVVADRNKRIGLNADAPPDDKDDASVMNSNIKK